MGISAKVVADSRYLVNDSPGCRLWGPRLTTFVLRYPRFIHAEFMTHRVFSRNASSSRAIPVEKLLAAVRDDPAMPVFWGRNQAGMQARQGLDAEAQQVAQTLWKAARDQAVNYAEALAKWGVHKQIVNRVVEPWAHIEVVCTATDWSNFYWLRNHADAQPEMKALAEAMLAAHQALTPKVLTQGQWHLPFITDADWQWLVDTAVDVEGDTKTRVHPVPWCLQKISAARCARVSYLKHDGQTPDPGEDLALYDRLMGGDVKHASPTEHQARVPMDADIGEEDAEIYQSRVSNLRGWVSFRKLIPGENQSRYEEFDDWGVFEESK